VQRLVIGFAALIAAALAGPAAAAPSDGLLIRTNVFAANGADPRLAGVHGTGEVYAPVGMVKTQSPVPYRGDRQAMTTGSGFMVSPCLFLTNYHGVFGAAPAVAFPPPSVTVTVWSRDGAMLTSGATPIAWGGLETSGRDDWALLQLDQCLGGRQDTGWFELERQAEPELFLRNLTTAGYADDLKSRFIQYGCRIHAVSLDEKALNDCANRGGTSGSPLFYLRDGVAVAVALQRGEINRTDPVIPAYSDDYANTAVLVDRILEREDVRRTIRGDLEVYGFGNPLRSAAAPAVATAAGPGAL